MSRDGLGRAWCRNLGHLPRIVYDHPRDPLKTREHCLRCGVWLDRVRATGTEHETLLYRIGGEEVRLNQ